MKKTRNYLNRNFKKERSDDLLPTKKRSKLMSKIRSRDTKLEKKFIASLKKVTYKKFQTNVTTIKGKPDVVFQRNRICIFLDSDFWHGWQYPRWKHLLKNDFWREKIESNRERDRRISAYLRKNNWAVLRFWEHELKQNSEKVFEEIVGVLNFCPEVFKQKIKKLIEK